MKIYIWLKSRFILLINSQSCEYYVLSICRHLYLIIFVTYLIYISLQNGGRCANSLFYYIKRRNEQVAHLVASDMLIPNSYCATQSLDLRALPQCPLPCDVNLTSHAFHQHPRRANRNTVMLTLLLAASIGKVAAVPWNRTLSRGVRLLLNSALEKSSSRFLLFIRYVSSCFRTFRLG